MRPSISDWRQHAVDLIERIDPDRQIRPTYVLDAMDAAEFVSCVSGGCTSIDLYSHVRPLLGNLGVDRGFGFCCILGGATTLHDVLSLCLHEYVHWCQHSPWAIRRFVEEQPVILDPPAPLTAELPDGAPPWCFHGADFIRLVIHASHRATGFYDMRFDPCHIVDPTQYGLGPLDRYVKYLADEPARLAHLSLAEVRATPFPDSYNSYARVDRQRSLDAWRFHSQEDQHDDYYPARPVHRAVFA